jgi:hypothetical protein
MAGNIDSHGASPEGAPEGAPTSKHPPLDLLHALDEALQKSSLHPSVYSFLFSDSPGSAPLDSSCKEIVKLVVDLYAATAASGDVSIAYTELKDSVHKCNSLSHELRANAPANWLKELNDAGQQLKDHLLVRTVLLVLWFRIKLLRLLNISPPRPSYLIYCAPLPCHA